MQEVKKPRKPLIYYYVIVLAVLLLFNFLFMPWAAERQVKEVGYDTFIKMTEKEEIGQVQINQEDNEVIFTNKDGDQVYKTGMVEDPGMTERLYESGAKFSGPGIVLPSFVDPSDRYLYRNRPVYVEKTDEPCQRRTRLHDLRNGEEQRQGICEIFGRHSFFRCCRRR